MAEYENVLPAGDVRWYTLFWPYPPVCSGCYQTTSRSERSHNNQSEEKIDWRMSLGIYSSGQVLASSSFVFKYFSSHSLSLLLSSICSDDSDSFAHHHVPNMGQLNVSKFQHTF